MRNKQHITVLKGIPEPLVACDIILLSHFLFTSLIIRKIRDAGVERFAGLLREFQRILISYKFYP
jgi:hypothetical protein